MIKEEMFT